MSYQQVIDAREFSLMERYQNIVDSGFIVYLELTLLMVLMIFMYLVFLQFSVFVRTKITSAEYNADEMIWLPKKMVDLILPIMMMGVAIYLMSFLFITNESGQIVRSWEENYVYPYVDSLPTEMVALEAADRIGYAPIRLTDVDKNKNYVPVSVIYANEKNEGMTVNVNALILFDAKDGSPYMEYKWVEKDLGFDYHKGFYNPVIHLPKGYYFNQ